MEPAVSELHQRDKEASRKAGVCFGTVGMTLGFVRTARDLLT